MAAPLDGCKASQYVTSENLRIRAETHRLYTESPNTFADDLVRYLRLESGLEVLDVGCGNGWDGWLHRTLCERGSRVVGIDTSMGMLAEATAIQKAQPNVRYVQGDAQNLPFGSWCFDRVLAIQMLYHVPRRIRALAEMRRVLRPGGRVLLTTYAAGAMRRLSDLHDEAARALGYAVVPESEWRCFTLDDLPLVRSVFPSATRHVLESAFVFPTAEPVLRFYTTSRIDRICNLPPDGSHREPLLAFVRDRIEATIAAEGVFRVPKNVGYFVADV
jgi:ubiquinone/menaquinone biosynthesis C-methylase UbiE